MKSNILLSNPLEKVVRQLVDFYNLSPVVKSTLWVLFLGMLATSLYIAPTIVSLALIGFSFGTMGLLVAWFRPEFALVGFFFLTSSFLPRNISEVGGGFELRDLAFMGLLGILFFRELVRKRVVLPWWPVSGPLLLFLVLAVFSGYRALFHEGVVSNWALKELRILSYYAVFFMVAWSIKQKKQLVILLIGLFIIADILATIIFLQQLFGANNPVLPVMDGGRWQVWDMGGIVRVVPAAHLLMHFVAVLAFCSIIFTRRNPLLRLVFVLQFIYIGTSLLLTFTRSQWLATSIAIALVVIVYLLSHRSSLIRVGVVSLSLLLLLYSLLGTLGNGLASRLEGVLVFNQLIERANTIFEPDDTLESDSLRWRRFETEQAFRSISENPILGVSLGNAYRKITVLNGEASGRMTDGSLEAGKASYFTRYLHSSYLAVAVKMGLPALGVLLWFFIAFLVKGWQLYLHLPHGQLKGIVLGILAAFVGFLQWAVFWTHFMVSESTVIVGLTIGLVYSISYIHRSRVAPSAIRSAVN